MDAVVPVYARGRAQPVGTVVLRQRSTVDGEMFLEVQHHGAAGLVWCRRHTDVIQPQRVYVLEDGTLWLSDGQHVSPGPVVAELVDW